MAASGKTEDLNRTFQEMPATFALEPDVRAGSQIGAIAFGGEPQLPVSGRMREREPE